MELFVKPTGSLAFESRTLARIFCPSVLFLDEEKSVLGFSSNEVVYDRTLNFSTYRRGGTVIFDVPSNARFAVIHTKTDGPLRFVSYWNNPSGYAFGKTFVRESGGEGSYQCGPTGDAIIRVR